jgi:hypothetical protein
MLPIVDLPPQHSVFDLLWQAQERQTAVASTVSSVPPRLLL